MIASSPECRTES